jgi:ABC-2 type transport system permease protein
MRLLTTEILRLSRRRMVFWMFLAMLALVAFIVVLNTAISKPDSFDPGDVMRLTDLWLSRDAARQLDVQREEFLTTISVLCYLLLVVLGASAVGAEYRAGTVTTVLTWEPRRVRLLLARFTATAVVAVVFFLVIHLVFVAGWALGAGLRGTTDGADGGFWRDLVFVLLRATVIAAVLAVMSAAIATLLRNTAGAMGVWFGYLVAVEGILRGNVDQTKPWMLFISTAAFYGWERLDDVGRAVTGAGGLFHLALYLALLGGAAVAVFTRRDVT